MKAKSKLCSTVHEKKRIQSMPTDIMAKMKKKLLAQKIELQEQEDKKNEEKKIQDEIMRTYKIDFNPFPK